MSKLRISINVDLAKVGMKLVEDVYNESGALIVAKDKIITERVLIALQMQSNRNIIVDVSSQEHERLSDLVEKYNETMQQRESAHVGYLERIKSSAEYKHFKEDYDRARDSCKEDLNKMVEYNKYIPIADMYEKTEFMLKNIESTGQLFDFIHIMRYEDESTYAHFLNVSLICNTFAKWLNFSEQEKEILTVAGVLHDIGKLQIPLEILTKQGKLTDEEYSIIKNHTIKGYKLLEKQDFDTRIKQVALMHHERCDGSGYPLRTNINNTPDFVKIVSIADVYEAMTASRCYRSKICPFVVIGIMESDALAKYDPKYSIPFFEKMAYTYIGHTVRLNDGREGKVAFINKHRLSKPIIIVEDEVIDTSADPNLLITEMT